MSGRRGNVHTGAVAGEGRGVAAFLLALAERADFSGAARVVAGATMKRITRVIRAVVIAVVQRAARRWLVVRGRCVSTT